MFSHVRIGSNDLDRSKHFYDAALAPLGIGGQSADRLLIYSNGGGVFTIGAPLAGAANSGNGYTVGFNAPSPAAVDDFHAGGLANGGTCEGAPGVREGYGIYAAYLRDPDGNKICAIAQAE